MSAKLRHLKRGFTLVELMIVVAIVGILAALAVYGVSKYVANAKTAEARNALGRMGKDAVSAFQREKMSGSVLALGATTGIMHTLCPSADAVPAGDPPAAEKYQSRPTDWGTGTGWPCLKFSMNEAQYFQYEYTSDGGGAENEEFACIARGDLDGDGVQSTFTLSGVVRSDEGKLVATIAPSIDESDPEE